MGDERIGTGPSARGGPVAPRLARVAAASIGALRRRRGWTLERLSQRLEEIGYPLGISQLSRIETGERRLSLEDFYALACALNADPVHLLDGTLANTPERIALTDATTVSRRVLRGWLRGRGPLPHDPHWRSWSGDPYRLAYRRAISDEDWAERQHTDLTLAIQAGRRIVEAAVELRELLPARLRHKLADAIDEFNRQLERLERSETLLPSRRPIPVERRGRPRRPRD